MSCDCFMCTHKDNPEMLYSYLLGQQEVYKSIIYYLKQNGIKEGHIGDDNTSLETFLACTKCNLEMNSELLAEIAEKIGVDEDVKNEDNRRNRNNDGKFHEG